MTNGCAAKFFVWAHAVVRFPRTSSPGGHLRCSWRGPTRTAAIVKGKPVAADLSTDAYDVEGLKLLKLGAGSGNEGYCSRAGSGQRNSFSSCVAQCKYLHARSSNQQATQCSARNPKLQVQQCMTTRLQRGLIISPYKTFQGSSRKSITIFIAISPGCDPVPHSHSLRLPTLNRPRLRLGLNHARLASIWPDQNRTQRWLLIADGCPCIGIGELLPRSDLFSSLKKKVVVLRNTGNPLPAYLSKRDLSVFDI
ncbi:uncharacterized protein BDR25DRAFT_355040 [Lindgomyces ingoldianus]|uniref:Uncharacterized protein n=1 Tax=Lindgomyces ingoldianus TaxID=673940 RepID=A0ACB6QU53_9PLEO|nr:uncharacterized protein BDR25DRAFT_355040 [Lindgomyces ingoldianus]KAF2470554.1 hypothetical protein BDR25DRAFT_355040 [Lindgomyces ingoldianus]